MESVYKHRLRKKQKSYSFMTFIRMFFILRRLNWLIPKESELYTLLYDLLQNENERGFIRSLLHRFVYLSDDGSRDKVREIAAKIKNDWLCAPSDTIICGAKNEDESNGSDVFLYDLRNALKWPDKCFRTTYSILGSGLSFNNVIIADDFTGSGKRMHETLDDIRSSMGPNATSIRFVSIAMMESVVKQKYPDILQFEHFVPINLEPGFNHLNSRNLGLMNQIEGYLAPRWKGKRLKVFHLGYKESGALYWNKQYRIPNNVYPVFWWGKKCDGSEFTPLFE